MDLLNPRNSGAGPPFEMFDLLLREDPVHWHEQTWVPRGTESGEGFWAIVKYEDVKRISRDWETFSSEPSTSLQARTIKPRDQRQFIDLDPPKHTAIRQIADRGFCPSEVKTLESALRSECRRSLDRLADRGEPFNFVSEFALEFPLFSLCRLLGVPEDDRDSIRRWSNALCSPDQSEHQLVPGDPMASYEKAQERIREYALTLARDPQRCDRSGDREPALYHLVHRGDRETMDPERFARFFLLLMVAGTETVQNALTGTVVSFLRHPDQWDRLNDDRSRVAGALREVLRYWTPVVQFRRTATREVELRGKTIREGDRVVLWYAAANRDPDVYRNPHRFDINREGPPPVSFGGGGPHFCLGAHLARAQLRVFLETLLERGLVFRTAGELDLNYLNTAVNLPVRLDS